MTRHKSHFQVMAVTPLQPRLLCCPCLACHDRLMEAAVEHLQHELSGVRTGRANPGLLENLLVDAHGDRIPIKACGSVTVKNAQLLAVVLYDVTVRAADAAATAAPNQHVCSSKLVECGMGH